jgi:beta-phosphoglucomutase-like phosphatase (HAD superfamily)
MTDKSVLKTLCPQLTQKEIDNAILKKNSHLLKIFKGMSNIEKAKHTTPGLFEFLNFLHREKKKLGVVSASEDIIVTETLKTFGISHYMEIQMGRNQTVLTKPHPDPYLEGMRRLNSTAHDTLIFEDSPTGLLSAHTSGAEIVRITEFSHSIEKSTYREIPNFRMLY